MPSRSPRDRLRDILDAIHKIQHYTGSLTREDLETNDLVLDAVLMNFVVIGEAAGSVPVDFQRRHPDVPWRKMREMRHVLVHVYFHVSKRIVWETLQTDLPPLAQQIQSILDAEPQAD